MELGYGDHLAILLELLTKEDGKPHNLFEISQATGISKSAVYKIYHNETQSPSYDALRKIANFFGIHADYFSCVNQEECIRYIAQAKSHDTSYIAQIRTRVTRHDQHVREAIEELILLLKVKSALGEFENDVDPSLVQDPSVFK